LVQNKLWGCIEMAYSIFFQAVDNWLADQGFHTHLSRGSILDGHALRKGLCDVKESGCANKGSCGATYTQAVLDQVKVIPGWTEGQARSALEAAELDPSDFEL
jgi:hypothetical protein